ncbi:subclass B3 metallo-beta-lactamase [Peristeroidobacter agariperforans]|uniref:subclass B3 metallo-beta-lactamase n=1 Tax=Peristeroidobacter agariperforans TaxID=268404 RepID=UPI00130057B5|nr:subclass B3 metallo-beta-lactamase [Peristeroidobacter agariperforans]
MSRSWILSAVTSLSLVGSVNAAPIECSRCEAWNKEQVPFQIYGNTYYVGPHGLSSVLITSPQGHVLIDGALPQSAPLIAKHVEQLGFKLTDVKVIVNSHTHYDHAGGIAELQKLTGAKVIASDKAAPVLRSGRVESDDPQVEHLLPFPAVSNVEALGQRPSLQVGTLKLSVIHTPGHAPGGTSWRWQSCEAERCLNLVYSDSLNAVSDKSFKYGGDPRWPTAAKELSTSMAAISAAPCDILITAHPELSGLSAAIDERGHGDRAKLIDSAACKRYVATTRQLLDKRLASEKSAQH